MKELNSLLYALRNSNFDNIRSNIESIEKLFQDTHTVLHHIRYSYDAEEMMMWVRHISFSFHDAKGDLISEYHKTPSVISTSTGTARRIFEEDKLRHPHAIFEFLESEFADP